MKFWDTSALFPLFVEEDESRRVQPLIDRDRNVIVAFITPMEIWSALWRRGRRFYDHEEFRRAQRLLSEYEKRWTLIDDMEQLTSVARRAITRHVLRTGDAYQLAAALLVAGDRPEDIPFVTLDSDLRRAASSEGLPHTPLTGCGGNAWRGAEVG